MKTIRKGVGEEIAEGFDWSDRLESGDVITDSVWFVDAGLNGLNAAFDNASTEIELTSGSEGEQYKVQNQVTTARGLIYERSFMCLVASR